MISDIDEIPDPKKIQEFQLKNIYACFMQKNFTFKNKFTKYFREKLDGNKNLSKKTS